MSSDQDKQDKQPARRTAVDLDLSKIPKRPPFSRGGSGGPPAWAHEPVDPTSAGDAQRRPRPEPRPDTEGTAEIEAVPADETGNGKP